jgi:predicted O-linked N-acetylglucosamine transferase (SPINDLY family)
MVFDKADMVYAQKNRAISGQRSRIGFLSSDFRTHSVAYFLISWLKNYNRNVFEFYAYSNVEVEDDTTAVLKSLFTCWRDIRRLSDKDAAHVIADDVIHILIDLNGHTGGNRLPVFAYKPAPVQISYCGYPNTTGLKSMDFRLTDSIADPAGAEEFYTEKLLRIPGCFLCYEPPADAPLPYLQTDKHPITFGSFNTLSKLNEPLIKIWSEILTAVPGSVLLLKRKQLADATTAQYILKLFAHNNISSDRILCKSHEEQSRNHLQQYGAVDICLDTFPYNGTTTTCEALWMGVPVVTLSQNTHMSRVSGSILASIGMDELVTHSKEEYLHKAISLAQNPFRISEMRYSLRDKMKHSELCDGKKFAEKMEVLFLQIFKDNYFTGS